jgi:hypothetical protein
MAAQTTNLFLLEDLEDSSATSDLIDSDLAALRAVADWINAFVARPNSDVGRPGPVCPFVPAALEQHTLWLVPAQIAGLSEGEVVELMNGYKNLFLDTEPIDGEKANAKVIVVVFTDLEAERAQAVFDDVQKHLSVPSYADAGILFGPFFKGNQGTALYNSNFRPFQSPVPFLFVRNGVVSDWKFFLDNDEMLPLWAHRFGESAVRALAEELRRLPWRSNPPGRTDASDTTFSSTSDLADAMRRAAVAHGEHEARLGHADANWPAWYAAYMVAAKHETELPA